MEKGNATKSFFVNKIDLHQKRLVLEPFFDKNNSPCFPLEGYTKICDTLGGIR
jgi:hypothetical protein